jgi:DNA-binding response OmpR family regulator
MNKKDVGYILVVDDDRLFTQFMKDILEEGFDHEVLIASTLQEALKLAHGRIPDLIFFDLNLPDGDGEQFCKEMAKILGKKTVPKWILSGVSPLFSDSNKWTNYGVDGYLVKPVPIDTIFDAVRKSLPPSSERGSR